MLTPAKPTVVTIGNFDGVHKGHQALLQNVKEVSLKLGLPSVVLTFDPHPLKVLVPQKNIKNIFDITDRELEVQSLGLDYLVIEPFSRELSEMSPEDFFKNLLVERLNVKVLLIGHDFTFGKNRSGTIEVLKKLGEKYSVEVSQLAPVSVGGTIISSSTIRESVGRGDVKLAMEMLGRPFYLRGVVEKGAGRGKKIGFPTANLFTSNELLPGKGVYITGTRVGEKIYKSLTNVGENPTFQGSRKHPIQVETHILNFNKDIYGESIDVYFYDFIRAEIKFDSVDKLIEQIKNDVTHAEKASWPIK